MMSVSEGKFLFRSHWGSCRKGMGNCRDKDAHDAHSRHNALHNLSEIQGNVLADSGRLPLFLVNAPF